MHGGAYNTGDTWAQYGFVFIMPVDGIRKISFDVGKRGKGGSYGIYDSDSTGSSLTFVSDIIAESTNTITDFSAFTSGYFAIKALSGHTYDYTAPISNFSVVY